MTLAKKIVRQLKAYAYRGNVFEGTKPWNSPKSLFKEYFCLINQWDTVQVSIFLYIKKL